MSFYWTPMKRDKEEKRTEHLHFITGTSITSWVDGSKPTFLGGSMSRGNPITESQVEYNWLGDW